MVDWTRPTIDRSDPVTTGRLHPYEQSGPIGRPDDLGPTAGEVQRADPTGLGTGIDDVDLPIHAGAGSHRPEPTGRRPASADDLPGVHHDRRKVRVRQGQQGVPARPHVLTRRDRHRQIPTWRDVAERRVRQAIQALVGVERSQETLRTGRRQADDGDITLGPAGAPEDDGQRRRIDRAGWHNGRLAVRSAPHQERPADQRAGHEQRRDGWQEPWSAADPWCLPVHRRIGDRRRVDRDDRPLGVRPEDAGQPYLERVHRHASISVRSRAMTRDSRERTVDAGIRFAWPISVASNPAT
jgi:hypothetical protein